jgi:hypothetical protein
MGPLLFLGVERVRVGPAGQDCAELSYAHAENEVAENRRRPPAKAVLRSWENSLSVLVGGARVSSRRLRGINRATQRLYNRGHAVDL